MTLRHHCYVALRHQIKITSLTLSELYYTIHLFPQVVKNASDFSTMFIEALHDGPRMIEKSEILDKLYKELVRLKG